MAQLIPHVKNFEGLGTPGEQEVAKALAGLPEGVVVYHSFPWLQMRDNRRKTKRYLQPGEIDFIVVDPQQGVLVLEVKDSEIDFDTKRHVWRQKNRGTLRWHDIDPFSQVDRNKYAVLDRLESHGVYAGAPPFTVGHAVVFPDHRLGDNLPAHVHPATVFEADSLRTMKGAVTRCLAHWRRTARVFPMEEEILDGILEALTPVFNLIPVLWRSIDQQEEKLHRLTENQAMILDMLQKQPRVAIEGVAGSGKTLLAMAQAQRYAREGKRTLLVCFNEPLATSLDNRLHQRFRETIHVRTFHQVCREFCTEARIPFAPDGTPAFWSAVAPDLLDNAADAVAAKSGYDAIVVDEAQDFSALWWLSLEKAYRTGEAGPLVAFFDPRQCIYLDEPAIPDDLSGPYLLPTNCRNTRQIADYCAKTLGFDPVCHPDAPKGTSPGQYTAADLEAVIERTKKTVQGWCLRDRGGLEPRQVAILTPRNNHKLWPQSFGNLRLYRSFDAWRQNKGVLLATHRRFKGLEAAALVLAGVPEPGSSRGYTLQDHYVASSRARHMLEVITLPADKSVD